MLRIFLDVVVPLLFGPLLFRMFFGGHWGIPPAVRTKESDGWRQNGLTVNASQCMIHES